MVDGVAPSTDTATVARTVSMLRVLANGTRLAILNHLMAGERSVAEIDASLRIGQPNLSQQLAELRAVGALVARREGKAVFYRLRGERVQKLVNLLQVVAGNVEADPGIPAPPSVKVAVGAARFAMIGGLDNKANSL
ncbi:MAG TPA: metalloregulator ArsR/SmtB family transcription factor [Acidocella sp.]|nr:metalloregulator ArsR/SmtB family transcription factor [Acidocella sp.]